MKQYDPSKHEWGTDASVKRAKELTPNEDKKLKTFDSFRNPYKEQVDIDPTDTGGAEETKMAMQQLSAMRHYLDGIQQRIESSEDMEEWFQNKLTKASVYLETLYSYSKGDLGESVEESLRKDIATNSGKFPEGSYVYHPKTGKLGKVMTTGKDFVKVAHGKKGGMMKDYHPSELKRIKDRKTPKKYKIPQR